jgi:hypothetical protein
VLEIDSNGHATIKPTRLAIIAQAPRGLAVAGGKLFVASFESGNQTEFPTCFPGDPRGLVVNENEAARTDEGCEFTTELFGGINPTTPSSPSRSRRRRCIAQPTSSRRSPTRECRISSPTRTARA